MSTVALEKKEHPLDAYLRMERLPHIWCSGCGLGIILASFLRSLLKSGLNLDKVAVVSGIGCTGRAAGYVKLDSFHTTHGRAVPFATGLKLANPELKVVLFSGDGDLVAIGGNHLIHAARRNINLTVICVNNFIYGMTGGQLGPTTPTTARTTTTRAGNIEESFNIPYLVAAAGAVYVARWTAAQVRQLEKSIAEALLKKGFSLVEVISPCSTYYGRMNKLGTALEMMRYYRDNSVVKPDIDLKDAAIKLGGQIVTGKFVDIERPSLFNI
jgi:2-oxoglutarate ferredoxin oxidoreductase subunit beta